MLKEKPHKWIMVRDDLKESVLNGILANGERLPSQKKLADSFQVNHLTIIRAINSLIEDGLLTSKKGSGTYVSHTHKEDKINQLHIGILTYQELKPSSLLTFSGALIRGILDELGLPKTPPDFTSKIKCESSFAQWVSNDAKFKITCLGEGFGKNNRHPSIQSIKKHEFDGLISLEISNPEWLDKVLKLKVPTIITDYPNALFYDRTDEVLFESATAYKKATQILTTKGCKNIFYLGCRIGSPLPSDLELKGQVKFDLRQKTLYKDPDSIVRENAFRQAMNELGFKVNKSNIHYEWDSIEHCMKYANSLTNLPKSKRPDAILCHNYTQYSYVQKVFQEKGIPLLGGGSSWIPVADAQSITILSHPKRLGETACQLLLKRISTPKPYFTKTYVPFEISSSIK